MKTTGRVFAVLVLGLIFVVGCQSTGRQTPAYSPPIDIGGGVSAGTTTGSCCN